MITLSQNSKRFGDKVDPIIFTHGQPHQIFTGLSEVAEKIIRGGFTFVPGTLPRVCWDMYKANRKGVVPYGEIAYVSIEHIINPEIISLLRNEIEILQSSK